ncbi:MAG TPA: GGDEF domain-containing protein, partial [Erysipelotrichaceae bacterium]|nr:GGDEF domain-containing protein [Erysipelotrichaceae bacterium]
MRRMSLKRKLPVLFLVILVLGLSLHTGKSIQAALISKRRQAAETVIELFGKHLIQQLEAENFASKLMFALDTKEKANLTLFEEKAAKLQRDHAEIRFLSYFEQDTLQA